MAKKQTENVDVEVITLMHQIKMLTKKKRCKQKQQKNQKRKKKAQTN